MHYLRTLLADPNRKRRFSEEKEEIEHNFNLFLIFSFLIFPEKINSSFKNSFSGVILDRLSVLLTRFPFLTRFRLEFDLELVLEF